MLKNSLLAHWKNFLPPRAWVMGKLKSSSIPPAEESQPDEAFPTSETTLITPPLQPEIQTQPSPLSGVHPVQTPTEQLQKLSLELQSCQKCKLSQGRSHLVFGEGDPQARLVFIGEAPGEEEDLHGRPFIGKAGELLDRMIAAMGLSREEVYILHTVKCRPPGNRTPEPEEIAACSSALITQLQCLHPQVIVALGKGAAQTLLQTEEPITQLRGRFHSYQGVKLMPTYHPAYLLRNPASKREVWWDLQEVAKELGLTLPPKK